MNKEKEALLKKILTEPREPHKVSMKSIVRLLGRMQPETEEMKDYIIAYYSSETREEAEAIHNAKYATLTPSEAKVFSGAFYRCLQNDLKNSRVTQLA
jgi:hypothetical protein